MWSQVYLPSLADLPPLRNGHAASCLRRWCKGSTSATTLQATNKLDKECLGSWLRKVYDALLYSLRMVSVNFGFVVVRSLDSLHGSQSKGRGTLDWDDTLLPKKIGWTPTESIQSSCHLSMQNLRKNAPQSLCWYGIIRRFVPSSFLRSENDRQTFTEPFGQLLVS